MNRHCVRFGVRSSFTDVRGVLFYTVGIAFTSGIFLRSFFDIGWAEILLGALVGVACWVAGRQKASGFLSPLFSIALILFSVSLGMARLHSAETTPSALLQYEGKSVSLDGRIVREPEVRETMVHLYLSIHVSEDVGDEMVLVTIDRFSPVAQDVSYGDTVLVSGEMKRPESFETDGGRVFDYVGYLKARGVSHMVERGTLEILEEERGTFLGSLFRSKRKFQEVLEQSIPEPYAGLGEGVLLGVKRALGDELEDVFRRTGIIHIVVLSGYNIMIVVEALMFVLSFFFFPRTRLILGVGAIALFALLVGLSATVVRASVMAGLLLVARTTGRTYAVLRALMFAGIGMLLLNPYLLVHDPGFQLSFLATLGLIILAPHIEVHLTRIPSMLGVRGFLTATIATQLFVLPLLLYQMGTLSIVSVVVNVLVLPMVPVAMLLTFLTGIGGLLFPLLGYGVGFFAYLSLGYITYVAQLFDTIPFAAISVPQFPFWIVLVVYALYVLALVHMYTRENKMTPDEEENEYADWTFEDENETSPEALRASGEVRSPFPFR